MRFVAKREFARTPLLRWLLVHYGALFVERHAALQSASDATALSEAASGKLPLFVFAEGTFTAEAGLRPFLLGGFVAATTNALPVIPVTLRGTRELLRDGEHLPRRGPVSVIFGAPVQPTGNNWSAAVRQRQTVRDAILGSCGEIDRDAANAASL